MRSRIPWCDPPDIGVGDVYRVIHQVADYIMGVVFGFKFGW